VWAEKKQGGKPPGFLCGDITPTQPSPIKGEGFLIACLRKCEIKTHRSAKAGLHAVSQSGLSIVLPPGLALGDSFALAPSGSMAV